MITLTSCLTRAAQIRGRQVATVYQGRRRTYAEVMDRTPRAAAVLRGLGLERGDRVAVLALNSDTYLELFFAVAWAGLVLVPLNTRWAVAENVYALADAQCEVLLVDDAFVGQVAALQAGHPLRHVLHFGELVTPAGMPAYEALLAAARPMEDRCGSGDDLCGIYYTGGTTGAAKGVMLSHTNMIAASINWIATLHFDEDTRYLHSAGLFHLAGASPALALTMTGGTHVFLPKFDPVLAMAAIEEHRVNYCLFVPTMVNMLLNHPAFSGYDLSSVHYCEYGASPMPDAVLAQAIEKLPTWVFIQGYGTTETAALNLSLPWKYHFDGPHGAARRRAAGRAAYGVDIRIVDEAGREVPRGTPGEIAVGGAPVMLGYWNKPEATAAVLKNGWLHTGDGAYMDDDGFVYIVDRLKDMIISGGENVYSKEVENAVHQHPAVMECAVIGIPDERWGEKVHAVVVCKAGMTVSEAELIAHCHTLIAGYKCPRSVELRDSLPLSGAGKLMKGALREPYWKGRDRAVH
jgi:long-chain acyl-CoA synthetase